MENLYVGEYIRNEKGIAKLIDIEFIDDSAGIVFKTDSKNIQLVHQSEVKEHSFEIKDLIEIGDFVNGKLIVGKEFTSGCPQYIKIVDDDNCYYINELYENDIKSVITHEQLVFMEYKIKEDKNENFKKERVQWFINKK